MITLTLIGITAISVFIAIVAFEYILRQLKKILGYNGDASTLRKVFSLFRVIFYIFLAIVTAGVLGANILSLLAGAGFLGIILGLACQAPLSNVFAWVFIALTRLIKEGDYIGIRSIGNAVEFEGAVRHIGFTHSELIGKEGNLNLVPNSLIIAWVIEHKPKGDIIV